VIGAGTFRANNLCLLDKILFVAWVANTWLRQQLVKAAAAHLVKAPLFDWIELFLFWAP
jgi:hypothetical protein